jgi:hypothetical protein
VALASLRLSVLHCCVDNRIAVKVIDDRGNELMVVKSLDEAEG